MSGTMQPHPAAAARELAPTGRLRAGVVQAPLAGVFFVLATEGSPEGVAVDILTALAEASGIPVEFSVFPNSGECTEALAAGAIDVAFMPVDDERRRKVAFGPAYSFVRSTFLIGAGSDIRSLADYQMRGRRFVGIAGTTTLRAAVRMFGPERAVAAPSVAEAMRQVSTGAADAIALSEDYLRRVQPEVPGSHLLAEAFQETSVSVAVPNGRPVALAYVGAFVERAKQSGLLRGIFDRHGLEAQPLAPAGV